MRTSSSFVSCLVAALISQSSAHFLLNYPPTIGFDDDLEGTAPCGSFTVDFSKDNVTDFHVGGDAIAVTSIHPQATWLFRATQDITASGNWTNFLQPVVQVGLGAFCEQTLTLPSSWAGSKGVIGVVQDAPDGILYQCAAVNFVTGTSPSPPTSCKNVTGLSASFTADAALSSLPSTASPTSGGSTPASTSSSAPAASSSKASAANAVSAPAVVSWLVMAGGAGLLAVLL